MKLISFEVYGLFSRRGVIKGDFTKDLSILTGRNGAGKTTLLKLLWYIVSGNILQALSEVSFQKVHIVTDKYQCTVHKLSESTCRIEWVSDGKREVFEDHFDRDDDTFVNAEDQVIPLLKTTGSSVFFPTFRRLEGGFTLNGQSRRPSLFEDRAARAKSDIEQALQALSVRLSSSPHTFVSSLSTVDIVSILLRQYADLSETYNRLQQNTSQDIIRRIRDYKTDQPDVGGGIENVESANSVIDEIRSKVEVLEVQRKEIMTPLEGVRLIVEKLFKHTGINIGTRLSFGEAAGAVSSDSLSAGEKQMLSFICYNAFYKDSIIFIDEPELSLHVDWQRQLFPTLLAQQSSNQFIIATHSPFIYSKYPDKEILIDRDRGDAEK